MNAATARIRGFGSLEAAMSRHVLAVLAALALAGCATTGGNSYYYDRDGDYYYGGPRADVVIDSGTRYYGGAGYAGFGGYGYSPWGWGGYGYGGYGYGYGYGGYGYLPWYYSTPIWSAPHEHPDPRDGRNARVERERSGRGALVDRSSDIQRPKYATPSYDRRASQPNVFRRDAMPGSGFAPVERGIRQRPSNGISGDSRPAASMPRRSAAPSGFESRQQSAPVRAPAPRPQMAPSREAPAASSGRAAATRRE